MNPSAKFPTLDAMTLERIKQALAGLRFGALEIVVHDFKVVRITRSEKVRLDTHDLSPQTHDDD